MAFLSSSGVRSQDKHIRTHPPTHPHPASPVHRGVFGLCLVPRRWTVEGIFSGYVGRENDHFVHYHIRRTYATLISHAFMVFGYLAMVYLYVGDRAMLPPADGWASVVGAKVVAWWLGLCVGLAAVAVAEVWRLQGWRRHPIVQRLGKYSGGWRAAAGSISTEFRRMDKIYVKLGFQAVLVTDRWIVRAGVYGLDIASQHDVDMAIASTQTVSGAAP
jgi:hypothetical protein